MENLKNFLLCFFLGVNFTVLSQVVLGTENLSITEDPPQSVALELRSTSQGFLLPRMTREQMQAIMSPAEGLLMYCTNCSTKGIYFFDGTNYVNLTDTDIFVDGGGGDTEIVDVVSLTGRTWMDRNLGAAQVATAVDDYLAYGHLYQWGRGNNAYDDNHQLINWTSSTEGTPQNNQTTATISTTGEPGDAVFILRDLTPGIDGNWTNFAGEDNLWQNGNDPCPDGYRIPTNNEWADERDTWTSFDIDGAYGGLLKIPAAGRRANTSGTITGAATTIYCWSSTIQSFNSYALVENNFLTGVISQARSLGASVRCIKEE